MIKTHIIEDYFIILLYIITNYRPYILDQHNNDNGIDDKFERFKPESSKKKMNFWKWWKYRF